MLRSVKTPQRTAFYWLSLLGRSADASERTVAEVGKLRDFGDVLLLILNASLLILDDNTAKSLKEMG